jgi:DNA-binding CsgD family transcriptional regulator
LIRAAVGAEDRDRAPHTVGPVDGRRDRRGLFRLDRLGIVSARVCERPGRASAHHARDLSRARAPRIDERLGEAIDLARQAGAFGLAERANDEIAATGARPRRVVQTGLDALTASERRVAQLAADGMSNKEVAQTLFVTIKTVETHLSHAYRKLDISSRAQLNKALLTSTPNRASASR